MEERRAVARPPLETWHAESLRLTVFPRTAVNPPVTWWNDLFAAQAERVTSNPRQGIHQEQGIVDEAFFTLRIDGTPRIDWAMSAAPTAEQTPSPPEVGLLPDVSETFSERMHRWLNLPSIPTCWRIAFGVAAWQPVDSLESGYQFLFENYLPHAHVDYEGMSDLFLQLNRPVLSNVVTGLRINQLSKWSVAIVDTLAVNADTADVRTQRGFAARIELDINTTQEHRDDLPREIIPRIFDEIWNLGLQIFEDGDTR